MGIGRVTQIDGRPIIDAAKPVTLEILDRDIAKADRKEPLDCVVARACRRDLGAKEVRVHLTRIYVRFSDGSWQRFVTPKRMRTDIIAFDRGGSFPPGSFVLVPPPLSQKLTGKREGSKNDKFNHASKNPNRKKRVRAFRVTEDVRSTPYG